MDGDWYLIGYRINYLEFGTFQVGVFVVASSVGFA